MSKFDVLGYLRVMANGDIYLKKRGSLEDILSITRVMVCAYVVCARITCVVNRIMHQKI